MESIKERSLFEVNKWGQIIPLNFVSLGIYGQCINALFDNFQYPQCFSVFIGYFLLCTTKHFTQEQLNSLEDSEKVKGLEVYAKEIIQFGWTKEASSLNVAVGELDTLVQTLCTISQVSKQTATCFEPVSAVCSLVENQWIQQSSKMMKSVFQDIPDGGFLPYCFIPAAKGDYGDTVQIQAKWFSLFFTRAQGILKKWGATKLDIDNFDVYARCLVTKTEGFDNLKYQIDYLNGSNDNQKTFDEMLMSQLPPSSTYKFLLHTGVFVHRKGEQLRFKDVCDKLINILSNDDVCHLFLMSILLNTDATRSLQNLYQHLLVKKLGEVCLDLDGENGDQKLCLLRRLVMDFIQLFGRFNLHFKKDMQKVTILKEDL